MTEKEKNAWLKQDEDEREQCQSIRNRHDQLRQITDPKERERKRYEIAQLAEELLRSRACKKRGWEDTVVDVLSEQHEFVRLDRAIQFAKASFSVEDIQKIDFTVRSNKGLLKTPEEKREYDELLKHLTSLQGY